MSFAKVRQPATPRWKVHLIVWVVVFLTVGSVLSGVAWLLYQPMADGNVWHGESWIIPVS